MLFAESRLYFRFACGNNQHCLGPRNKQLLDRRPRVWRTAGAAVASVGQAPRAGGEARRPEIIANRK